MLRNISSNILRNTGNFQSYFYNSVAQSTLTTSPKNVFHRPYLLILQQYQPIRNSQWSPLYREPVITEEHENWHREHGSLESLAFSPIKAAQVKQNSSLFSDSRLQRFLGFLMRKGKRALARTLMEETFFEIKQIQFIKLNKMLESEKRLDAEVKAEEAKSQAKSAKYYDLEELRERISQIETDPLKIFHKAIDNCTIFVETRAVKRGGVFYQVPYPVTPLYGEFRAMKWVIEAVKERPKPRRKIFSYVMARELIEASMNDGKVVRRKQDMHRQAEANKTYSHYRWG